MTTSTTTFMAAAGTGDGEEYGVHCHYCGFCCEEDAPPRHCPKCGASAWEWWERRATLPPAPAHPHQRRNLLQERLRLVLFRLWQPARRIYLVIRGSFGEGGVIELQRVRDDHWQKLIYLRCGTYRYRYYVDDGRCLTCLPADDHSGQRCDSLDGVLHLTRKPSTDQGPLQVRSIGFGAVPTESSCG